MAAYVYNRMQGTVNRFVDILPNTIQVSVKKSDASQAKASLQAATLALIAHTALKSTYLPEIVSYPIATVSIVLILKAFCHNVYSILSQKKTTPYSLTLFKGGLAALTLTQLSGKIISQKAPSNAVSFIAVTAFFTAVIVDKKRDETIDTIYGGPRNLQKDFLLAEILKDEIKALEHKLRFFDRFVISNPQLLQYVLEHNRKHPGVFRERIHPPLPKQLSENDVLVIKKSRIEFDLESRFLYLQQFPELKAEFENTIRNSKHLLKEF